MTRLPPWEFWPTWASYPPVVAWIGWLALKHGGLAPVTAANPGFQDGGLVGESKFDIQSRLPVEWAVPAALIAPGPAHSRLRDLEGAMHLGGWNFPIVLKPDVGQRGAGVRKIRDRWQAEAYLRAYPSPTLAQPWHPGPFEAGVFYARHPDEAHGRVLSITDKVFAAAVGDGRRSIEALIGDDQRLSRQAGVFLARLGAGASRVPARGERVVLGEVGNHAQGTRFLDGRSLWTPELEARFDEIARAVPGFFIGRFDVRYRDTAAFMAGQDLAIVELNGVSAEPTDIYDPSRSMASAYQALFEQWSLVFEIGAANLRRGHDGASAIRLVRLGLRHLTDRRVFPTSS